MKKYPQTPEVVLGNVTAIEIPEIKVRYNRSTCKKFLGKITKASDVAEFLRKTYKRGEIGLQEQFIVLYLNQGNQISGYYKHTIGAINSTLADVRIILATALKTASVSIILAHNHPSGANQPSTADKLLTEKIKQSAELMSINVLDHVIVTKDRHYSFADEGLLGLSGIYNISDGRRKEYVNKIESELRSSKHYNKTSVEKLAATFGITDKTEVKELTELAIVRIARGIAHTDESYRTRFEKIVELYNSQVTLSHRTSQSIMLQQYSTPAPIGFLACVFVNADNPHVSLFEPSAGNGLLTICADPDNTTVNEIDEVRNGNLRSQGFKQVMKQDATEPFAGYKKTFDAVITNPPFGKLDRSIKFDNYPIGVLDHLMAIRALDTMKDNGKAAIIIGGHTEWDSKGRIQAGKNLLFFNYLYSHYHVKDVINIDGKLYSRQGTSFNVRLILIDGRKQEIKGAAPVLDKEHSKKIKAFNDLYERVMDAMDNRNTLELEAEALSLELELYGGFEGVNKFVKHIYRPDQCTDLNDVKIALQEARNLLKFYHSKNTKAPASLYKRLHGLENLQSEFEALGAPYVPASQSCVVLNTVVPDSMEYETHSALERIRIEVGGDIDEFVRQRLKYRSQIELCKALSAEQTDAVAMAIYNIEARKQGMIIGDQTGIGKGRVAAAMIRYGVVQGHKPIFITEKANLFSDIYRDLVAIGSAHLVPFIVNGRESKTDIKDEQGEIIYQALPVGDQQRIFKDQQIPGRYDFVVATYSQFNSPEKKPEKPAFLNAIAEGNILIMDESHNSSGSSNTGEYLQSVVAKTMGVVFLSATFAKRPDNMPVYAMKTAISDANMTKEELVDAITKGGVALQEVLASQLVAEGQMLRRERSFEGVEVNYITLDDKEQEHRAIADNITEILRDIISFQTNHIDDQVDELDSIAVAEGKQVDIREGTSQAGVDNQPYFSKVFNVINQMLFSIKAEAVAERAIQRLQEGKKPVIAFASTMGSFIEQMENDEGIQVSDGDTIRADFTEVLLRGLEGVLRYTETGPDGEKVYKMFQLTEMTIEAQNEYIRISEKIKSISSGITISPIDVIVQKLKKAGYSVAEVTGRKYELQINTKTNQGLVLSRKKINTNDAFRGFNDNEIDVLLINQSGSTGASAHAIVTKKVPAQEVKQRVMIVLQAELNINTEVQKRGRINRTGQIKKPIYDYVTSAIPAEKRLMMMLQKKLKSLDANTSSNQKQSSKILDVADFLNKYGDKIVSEYLKENPEINKLLNDPLGMEKDQGEDVQTIEDAAHKVSGRVAVLSTKMQQDFYNEISSRYYDYEDYLKQTGEYDLEVEAMDLQAETLNSKVIKVGKGGQSQFGDDSILESVMANVLKKPFSRTELDNLIIESLQGKDAKALQQEVLNDYQIFIAGKLKEEIQENKVYYENLIKKIPEEKKIKKILEKEGRGAWEDAIREREKELSIAHSASDNKIEIAFANRKQYMDGLFKFFYVGKNINYPVQTYDKGQELIPSVFLGFIVDKKKRNPYAPSALRLRFAIASSNKYLAIPASYSTDITAIKGASAGINDRDKEDTLNRWEETVKEGISDRTKRHIITGNLLQAFSLFKGKLVSYTTADGATKKGILMPEYWEAEEGTSNSVVVPIERAMKAIKGMTVNSSLSTNNGVGFFRRYNDYRIIVPASNKKGGEFYLDKDLRKLVDKGMFEKTADKMVAAVELENITEFVSILQSKFNTSITLNSFQYEMIKNEVPKRIPRAKIELPKIVKKDDNEEIRILELEAEALELELELAE
jgi:DNA repair protein RadC